MKAAVCREFGAPLSIEDLDLAGPGLGQVQVRIAACAICHSDISYAEGLWGSTLPAVLGHEAAGIVTETGPGVRGISTGDRVLVTLIRACGGCPACRTGAPTNCTHTWETDSPLRDANGSVTQGMSTGAFAEAVTVDQSQIVRLPEGLDMAPASLLSCGVLTGVGAVTNTAKLRPGETCAVIGAGGVGLNTIQGAAIAGASKIFAVDIADERLDNARRFGATHGLRGDDPDHPAQLRALTHGLGVDYAFVTTGAVQVYATASALLAPGGAVVLVGMPATDLEVPFAPTLLASMNQRLLGSRMGQSVPSRDVPWLIDHYTAGRLQLDTLITARYPLSAINEAIEHTLSGHALRNVITFEGVA